MKFDRFRAYARSTGTKSEWLSEEDDEGVVTKERRVVESWDTDDVAFEGEPGSDGETAEFDAGETVVTRVVFYRGAVESERAVGEAEIGRSGSIAVRCPDRKPRDEGQIALKASGKA